VKIKNPDEAGLSEFDLEYQPGSTENPCRLPNASIGQAIKLICHFCVMHAAKISS
jgi:hypothetical protein